MMHSKELIIRELYKTGVVAVIRVEDPSALIEVAEALLEGGVNFVEITMTVPGALKIIEKASAKLNDKGVYIDGDGLRLRVDNKSNKYLFSEIYIDEQNNKIVGSDIKSYFNQSSFKLVCTSGASRATKYRAVSPQSCLPWSNYRTCAPFVHEYADWINEALGLFYMDSLVNTIFQLMETRVSSSMAPFINMY